MNDIVERLRLQGENAMRQHLSLGMHKLCEEAAAEIERLQSIIDAPLPCEVKLPPATIFGMGVPLSTVLLGIEQRRKWPPSTQRQFSRSSALSPESQ